MAELPLPAGLNASTFPAKLWRLASSPRVRSVRWDSRAQGLLIDRSLFERELLSPGGAHVAGGEGAGPPPDSFQATHFGSFVRQLNLYGFQKVPGWVGSAVPGDARGCLHYRNPNFRRDRPELLLRIQRLTRANRQRLAAGLEPSRFQQLHTDRPLLTFSAGQPPRAAPSCQNLAAASHEGSELLPGPSRQSAGPQVSEVFLASHKKVFATSGLHGISTEEPGTCKFQVQPELIIPLVRMDLKCYPELTVPPVPVNHDSTSVASPESSSSKSSEQHTPVNDPSATPGTSAPSAPAGYAGYAPWTAPRWLWYTPGEEELPPLDLDLVLETLEEMLSTSPSARSPSAQDTVAPECSGGEPVNKAAAGGVLPGTENCRNSSQEPKELDIHLIYLARRAALRAKERPRESL
ncbi:PREDICTED: uncharacterized protein LOC101817907 [Ficedula albicollis]|uniref:uncharacterized protein LOC101817907 n=1 Tax=Ficedula albicollis TaxID=59894 RepID=UPI0007AD8EDF|nr:PREDICTED: uncharacterized protein LOC101817907 [Ficedula albicollis]